MEYFLRQIDVGNPDPLTIDLKNDDVVVGKDIHPCLAKYPGVLPQHARFEWKSGRWLVSSMQSSEKIHVNGIPLVTHRKKEIQTGDHITFGNPSVEKRFVCSLESCKRPEIEVIDLRMDDSPVYGIRSIDHDQIVKNESTGGGGQPENMIKSPKIGGSESTFICPPTVKSEHVNDSPPFKRKESMDWSPAAIKSEFDDSCPPTVRSDSVEDSSHSRESGSKYKNLPSVVNEVDYICPSSVINDHVPFIKSEPQDISLPVMKNESFNNKHSTIKNDPVSTNSPVVKSKPSDTDPPLIKSEHLDTNPPVVKSEPIDISNLFTEPANALPSASNEHIYNSLPSVEHEPVYSSNKNPRFSNNVFPSTSSQATEYSLPSSKKLSSTNSSQNVHADATSIKNKISTMNSGYSEVEDVITISDDEAYLDYGSCQSIKQESPGDDFNRNYLDKSGFTAAEVHGENNLNLLSLIFGDDSSLTESSINESIKEHEESAKKMLDDDSSSKISQEYSSFSGKLNQNFHNAYFERESSNSSVSSHEDIIIPFAKKIESDSSTVEIEKSENNIKKAGPLSRSQVQSTASIVKPSSSLKNQPLKRTLPTEPKPLGRSLKKIRKLEEVKKTSEEIKIAKKSKYDSILSGSKALSSNASDFSSQKDLTSSLEDKCVASKKPMKASNKKSPPSKPSTGKTVREPSKISNGVVVTEKLGYKIPKVRKSALSDTNIVPSTSERTDIEATHEKKELKLDKKTPSIARKPNKCASRSEFLISDFSTEKPRPVKKISAVSKANIKTNKLTNSSKMNSSTDREINKTRKITSSGVNSSVTTELIDSQVNSSADLEMNGPELHSSNVLTGVENHEMSLSADRGINKTREKNGSKINSPNVSHGIKSSSALVPKTPPNLNCKKSLNKDRNLPTTALKINRPTSQNRTLPNLSNEQFYGPLETNFENDGMHTSDKKETSRTFQPSIEQNVSKHNFTTCIASNSTNISGNNGLQQNYKDQGLDFKNNPHLIHPFDKIKTPEISQSMFRLNTDATVISKQQAPFSVASTSSNTWNDLQRLKTSDFSIIHPHETALYHTNSSDRKSFIIKTIVEWKEIWFKEYEKMNKPHPNLVDNLSHLPLCFNSFEDYISSFMRLLLLEIWEKVYIEYKPIWKDENMVKNKFYFIVTSAEMKRDVTEYKCEALINHLSFKPTAGNLVILLIDNRSETKFPIIGCIKNYEILNSNSINPVLLTIDPPWIKAAIPCCFTVLVKIRYDLSPGFNKIMKGHGLFCLRNYFNLVEASENLEYSPLCPSVLKPELSTFFSNYPDAPSTSIFSKTQMSIIQGISSEVEKQVSEPKFFLVQGAPGTGKTRVILGLLENLIFACDSKQKILIVAPSSVALDEISSRLNKLNESSRSRRRSHSEVRFVIAGKTSEKMRTFSLDGIYQKYKIQIKIERLENLMKQIQKLIKSNDHSDQDEVKCLLEQQKELKNQIEFIQSDEKTRLDYYHYLLQESEVILTAVSYCSSPLLQEFCKQNSNSIFSCCIIDEVTQCTELEFLQVVSLGINKLILVGDIHGLPATVLSHTAESFGFGRSAFERFLEYFSHSKQKLPVKELFKQHRMHSEICYFPSLNFYNNLLSTANETDSRYEHFLAFNSEKMLAPYTVFYIRNCIDPKLCADAVIKLCIQAVTFKPHFSVGIIVPSQELQDIFTKWATVLKKSNPNYEVIEVGTVENFQAQEKDLVFLCCYYDGYSSSFLSNRRKLNVALTRARQCLVLCIFSPIQSLGLDWDILMTDAQNRDCCYVITKTKDISLIFR